MAAALFCLETEGFVSKYEAAGEEYGLIPTFLHYQQIDPKETVRCPPPPGTTSQPVVSQQPATGNDPESEQLFAEFWSAYPKKGNRKPGRKATWLKWQQWIKPEDRERVIRAAGNYADHCRREDRSIRDPENFLVSGRGKEKTHFWEGWEEAAADNGRPGGLFDEDDEDDEDDGGITRLRRAPT